MCSEAKEKAEAAAKHAAAVAGMEGALAGLKAGGAQKYKIVKSENDNICEKCQAMDGKEFSIDEAVIGETAPPFHPNCGCSIAIVGVVEGPKERPKKDELYCNNEYLTLEQMQTNAKYIYNKLLAAGWSKNAICAVLGNLETESTINPGLWQSFAENNMNVGFGLVQWTPAGNYFDWAEENGLDPYDIDTQLSRILLEAKGEIYQWQSFRHDADMSFDEFTRSAKSPEELAEIFCIVMNVPKTSPNQSAVSRLNIGMNF